MSCWKISLLVRVTQSCLTLCHSVNRSLSGSSVHGILQARTLDWIALPFSRRSSLPGMEPKSPLQGRLLNSWAILKASGAKPIPPFTLLPVLCALSTQEHPGLISFRMDWLDLLAVQGNLKSLLQHHSSKASILQRSAFFTVQLSHPYMTTGKTIALARRTFVGSQTQNTAI